MITLVAVSGLGIICLLLEILSLRKILIPMALLGLIAILGVTVVEFSLNTSFLNIEDYNMIITSRFTEAFSILLILLSIFVIALAHKFYDKNNNKITDYISLKIFMLAGAIAMISFGNFAMFFIGLEILSICAYVLASSNPQYIKSNEAGMKYFIMGAFASGFILFGIALVYGATGSFDIEIIRQTSFENLSSLPVWFNLGFVMLLVGMLFKASVVPFHFWAPDVYEGSPTIVTTIMSTLIKVAAICALYKILNILYAAFTPTVQILIIVFAMLSMIVANITAMKQTNLKRIMAYSGISHAGFMLMAFVTPENAGNSILYYATAYSLASIGAFSVILGVCRNKGDEDISNIFGLARLHPLATTILVCAMVSLGGIPVFAGFFAKLFVFSQMFEAKQIVLVMCGVICSIIAIFYYFGIVNVMFTKESIHSESFKISRRYMAIGAIAIILNILIGVFPSIIMDMKL